MGLTLVPTPWLLSGETELSRWNDVLTGIALIDLSIRRGRITARFEGLERVSDLTTAGRVRFINQGKQMIVSRELVSRIRHSLWLVLVPALSGCSAVMVAGGPGFDAGGFAADAAPVLGAVPGCAAPPDAVAPGCAFGTFGFGTTGFAVTGGVGTGGVAPRIP